MRENVHLDEDQLVRAVVDESELPVAVRDHLSVCSTCRAEKERLERDLARLGQMAKHFAPSSGKRVVLPLEKPKGFRRWFWNWRMVLVTGVAAVGVIVVALWFVLFMTAPEKGVATLAREMWEDERFMGDVTLLEENALSPIHQNITGEFYPVLDEEFMEFVVPSVEDIT